MLNKIYRMEEDRLTSVAGNLTISTGDSKCTTGVYMILKKEKKKCHQNTVQETLTYYIKMLTLQYKILVDLRHPHVCKGQNIGFSQIHNRTATKANRKEC